MGIYSAKLALESSAVAPEDVINTPGDIGADLDEIEKAIAGPDGLEANREEIEAAQTGLIGDPVEESFIRIYESEYNYNQIMHTIGIHELSAASCGRDFILEAADKDGFFKRILDWLKAAFEKVVKAFKFAIGKIAVAITDDKKFAEKHKDAIIAGGKGDWTAKGFIFKDKIEFDKARFAATDWSKPAAEKIADIRTMNSNVELGEFDDIRQSILDKAAKGANDLVAVRDILYKELRNGEDKPVELNASKIDGNDVYKILTGADEKKAIEAAYNEVKNSYKESQKAIEQMRATLKKSESDITTPDAISRAFSVCEFYTRAVKFEKQVQDIVAQTLISAAREKRAQARKLAVSFVSNYKKPAEDKGTSAKNESGLFGGIKLM